MKKLASIAVIAVFAIAFTSCKKEYMCKCTFTTGTEEPFFQATGLGKSSKDDAKAVCDKQKGTIVRPNTNPPVNLAYTCTLEE